jgi:hypothetical protein
LSVAAPLGGFFFGGNLTNCADDAPDTHGSVSRHFDFSNLCNHVRKALAIWKNVVASDGMRFGLGNYAGFGNA